MNILRKILCFLGLHNYEDCDECEVLQPIDIMRKCIYCGKITGY